MAVNTIFECCEQNDTKGLKAFIQSGANLNEKTDYYGWTPLRAAAANNSKECLQLLLEAGAEIDVKDGNGWTPLHAAAAIYNSKEHLQFLLEAGADLTIKDNYGKTPLDYIRDKTLKKEIEEYANVLSTSHLKEPDC